MKSKLVCYFITFHFSLLKKRCQVIVEKHDHLPHLCYFCVLVRVISATKCEIGFNSSKSGKAKLQMSRSLPNLNLNIPLFDLNPETFVSPEKIIQKNIPSFFCGTFTFDLYS